MINAVKNPEWEEVYPVHTSTFRIDERTLAIGAASLVLSRNNESFVLGRQANDVSRFRSDGKISSPFVQIVGNWV